MRIAIITDIPMLYEETMYLAELEKRLEKLGITADVFVVNAFRSRLEAKFGFLRLTNATALLKSIKNYDLLHIQFTFPLGFLYTSLSHLRLQKRPILIHTHGYDVFIVPSIGYGLRRNRLGAFLARQAWRSASRIIAVCEKSKIEICKEGVESDKITVLYNGVNHNMFGDDNQVADERLISIRESSDLIFLNVGSFTPVKNQVRLLQAFDYFSHTYSKRLKAKLMLVGDGPERKKLVRLANKNVIFLDNQPHHKMPEIYNLSDVFMLPSLSEAHPWSLLEAMSCGLPAIASNVGGIPETLSNTDLLVDPWDVKSIYNRMMYIAEMSDRERKHLGKINRNRICEWFTLDRHVQTLVEIYEFVLR